MMQRVIAHTDQKGFVNDQLFCKKKTLILQDEMGRITGTLFDHRLRKESKDKGWRAHSKFSARNAWILLVNAQVPKIMHRTCLR